MIVKWKQAIGFQVNLLIGVFSRNQNHIQISFMLYMKVIYVSILLTRTTLLTKARKEWVYVIPLPTAGRKGVLIPNRVHALEMHPLPFCSALLNPYKSIYYFIYTFKCHLCYTKDQYLEAEVFACVI